ncbi:MAG: pyruvate formate lyase-activating protein [Desulfobacca sp.]|nr:pyruvate formate lyase-activating protein [Desulfobacca sp.]
MDHSPKLINGKSLLALDIGGGTQDLLVWTEGEPLENALQCILPSPTIMVARKIRQATQEQQAIFLTGLLMGGGASSKAIRNHLEAGLPVYAQARSALTLRDNLDQVVQMGITLSEEAPPEAVPVRLTDIQAQALDSLFSAFELDLPEVRLVAVQDHGFSPQESNRRFRFQHWEKFLKSDQPLESLLYQTIPEYLTRMKAIQESWPQARVMDTGAAAILGALEDEQVQGLGSPELIIVNIGNEHTLAAWLVDQQIQGIYEHHTGFLNPEKLLHDLSHFFRGNLLNDQVLKDRGHGCINRAPGAGPLPPIVVTGPRRKMLAQVPVLRAAPFGNMMLSGCFGLLRAFRFANPA